MDAVRSRPAVGASYTGLLGTGGNSGMGSVFKAGGILPTPYSVFGFSLDLSVLPDTLPFEDAGWMSRVKLSFSKALYPNLFIGAAGNIEFGGSIAPDWGLNLDLGIAHRLGDLGFLRGTWWGVSVRGLGKGFRWPRAVSHLPETFTPTVSIGTRFIETEAMTLDFSTDLSFPRFQNVRVNAGLETVIGPGVTVGVGYSYDMDRALSGSGSGFPLSFSAGYRFSPGKSGDVGASEYRPPHRSPGLPHEGGHAGGFFVPTHRNLLVFGGGGSLPLDSLKRKPITAAVETEPEQYISPNDDGIQDLLEIPTSVSSPYRLLAYRLSVFDDSGTEVRGIGEDAGSDIPVLENEDSTFFQRFFAPRTGYRVPAVFQWHGLNDDGKSVPEGKYTYFLEAEDELGRISRSAEHTVVVDITPPEAEITVPYTAFSPDGEGERNVLPVHQGGSSEDLWSGEFKDSSGKTVRKMSWEDGRPADFEWDGRNDQNELLPDGRYDYRLNSTDRAGNSTVRVLEGIIINTQDYEIEVDPVILFFSPGTDEGIDEAVFSLAAEAPERVISWDFAVRDSRQQVVYREEGTGTLPAALVFTGRDEDGEVLPEGKYRAEAAAHYDHGKSSYVQSEPVTLDVTPPEAEARTEYRLFSPDGDGRRDTVTLYNEASGEKEWILRIEDDSGGTVRSEDFPDVPPPSFTWDGTDDRGNPVPDGTYAYILEAEDRAGNTGRSNVVMVEVDTRPTPVEMTVDYNHFSPAGTGARNTIPIRPVAELDEGIDRHILRVIDAEGSPVLEREEEGAPAEVYEWDGRGGDGQLVPDGGYTAEVELFYRKGNRVTDRTDTFWVDTVPPKADLEPGELYFSPDDPAGRSEIRISQDTSEEDLWEGAVYDADDNTVRTFRWEGTAGDVVWDGRDDAGDIVPDGTYRYVLFSRDKADNSSTETVDDIVVDTRDVEASILATEDRFAPNDDGFKDSMIFHLTASPRDAAASWSLEIIDADGDAVRSFEGTGRPPQDFVWDGTDGDRPAAEGMHTGNLTVHYLNAKRAEDKSGDFLLDVSPPVLSLEAGPFPFGPDGDGVRDELTIELGAEDPSPVEQWEVRVLDPRDVPFKSWSGEGVPPDSVTWDGYSETGELVQSASDYELIFSAEDSLQNRSEVRKTVPTDILVIQEGDQLKIQISSITFEPNSADFRNVPEDRLEQNLKTLDQLAEKLGRYPDYQITIQGHANMVYWFDEERGRREHEQVLLPLSEERAKAVRRALEERGIQDERMDVRGVGGNEPIVPFSDTVNRWKNRRVEFILRRRRN